MNFKKINQRRKVKDNINQSPFPKDTKFNTLEDLKEEHKEWDGSPVIPINELGPELRASFKEGIEVD